MDLDSSEAKLFEAVLAWKRSHPNLAVTPDEPADPLFDYGTVASLRQSQTHVDKAKRQEIEMQYAAGISVKEIAAAFAIHRKTVREIAKSAGLAPKPRGMSADHVEDAARLYASGLSLASVGQRLGFDASTVMIALKGRGVEMRPRRGGRRASSSLIRSSSTMNKSSPSIVMNGVLSAKRSMKVLVKPLILTNSPSAFRPFVRTLAANMSACSRLVAEVLADGRTFLFESDGAGVFKAPAGAFATLTSVSKTAVKWASTLGESATFTLDEATGRGALTAMTDRQGNTTSLAYGGAGTSFPKLASITDQAGQVVKVEADGVGRITALTPPVLIASLNRGH